MLRDEQSEMKGGECFNAEAAFGAMFVSPTNDDWDQQSLLSRRLPTLLKDDVKEQLDEGRCFDVSAKTTFVESGAGSYSGGSGVWNEFW